MFSIFLTHQFFLCLLKGLSDEIHTVIKHSLSAIDISFPLILPTLMLTESGNIPSNRNAWRFDDLNAVPTEALIRIDQMLDELLIVGTNKNWVVQSKYCELVANIDFTEIRTIMGDEFGWFYEVSDSSKNLVDLPKDLFVKYFFCFFRTNLSIQYSS